MAYRKASESLVEAAKRPWLDVASEISGSIVYLDTGAAEFVHVSLGAPFLYGLGAAHVCDLEAASADDALLPLLTGKQPTTLVIAITRLLTDAHPHILRAALAHANVRHVLILSSVSEHAHACAEGVSEELGVEAFREYASMLSTDVQDSRASDAALAAHGAQGLSTTAVPLAVSVRALPLALCALDATTFVLPAGSAAASLTRGGGVAAGLGPTDAHASAGGAADMSPASGSGLSLLAHELGGIVGQLGMRLEAWSVGPVSQQIAHELAGLPMPTPQELPGRNPPTLGVVLLDRALDAATPAFHHDSLADMLLAGLPRGSALAGPARSRRAAAQQVQWRSLDVRVDAPGVAPIHTALAPQGSSSFGVELLAPGDRLAAGRLEQLVVKKSKDGAALVRKWLKQSLAAESLQPSVRSKAGGVTPAELLGLSQDLANAGAGATLRQRSAVVLGAAAAGVLGQEVAAQWEAAGALERQIGGMLCGAGDGGAVAAVLIDALSTAQAGKGALGVADIVSLLPAIYSLTPDIPGIGFGAPEGVLPTGPFSPQDEDAVKAAVATALLAAQPNQGKSNAAGGPADILPELGSTVAGGVDVGLHVEALFSRLHYLAQARRGLSALRRISVGDVFAENAGAPVPLVRQVVRHVVAHTGEPLPDYVQANSASLAGMLTKGLGRFGLPTGLLGAVAGAVANAGSSGRPTLPAECDVVLIFVVGGISLAEMREVRQEVEAAAAAAMQQAAATEEGATGGGGTQAPQVLLGGTALLAPADIARLLA